MVIVMTEIMVHIVITMVGTAVSSRKSMIHSVKNAYAMKVGSTFKGTNFLLFLLFLDPIGIEHIDEDPRCKPVYIGDGLCDDENNRESCQFDQGDCCRPPTSPFVKCEECLCLDEKHKDYEVCFGIDLAKGDHICDDFMNVPECDYDGNDCCKPWASFSNCDQCECHDPNLFFK